MARDWMINGPALVTVKGRSDSLIGGLSQLGLTSEPVTITPVFHHKDIRLDAYGGMDGVPAEVQFMLSEVRVDMTLIHYDPLILDVCMNESMGGAPLNGQMSFAGATLGNNQIRFAPGGILGNHYIGLNISSPVFGKPYRFFYSFLTEQPVVIPLGAEKSMVKCQWRVIPYTQDPY